jgi:AbrB family looped-hinge helix DNA binding protein
MVQINITKMSSKGQIVIPSDMRKNIKEGEKIVIIQNGDQLILKKAKDFSKNIEEDLIFAKRTEEAWKRYDKGEFISMDFDDFLKEAKKW